ncbi:MAG: protein kinase, partial [Gemmatimonadaceae bacterium]
MSDPMRTLATALSDRYVIEREIGVGGMATVYLAEDVKHRRKVAIKVLHPELSALLGPERFLKEIELTANLQHPHILPLFDSGNADGHLYYVMPYVEGETLRRRLEREQQLPVAEAVRIA